MVLQHEGQAVASVNLSPGRERPYSVAYVALGTYRMGGTSHETRMAAIRHCERWAWSLPGHSSLYLRTETPTEGQTLSGPVGGVKVAPAGYWQ